jgi:hypothetical protein
MATVMKEAHQEEVRAFCEAQARRQESPCSTDCSGG